MTTANDDTSQTDQDGSNGEGSGTPDLSALVNAAVTSHLRRFAEKQLPTLLADAMKPLTEQITALKTPKPAGDDESGGRGKSKVSPEVAAALQKVEELQQKLADEAKLRADTEERARKDRAVSEFKGHLGRHVRPEMLDVLTDHLFKKAVEFDDNGNPMFKGEKVTNGYREEVLFPLKDGVEGWAKSEAAKPWLPPPSPGSNTPQNQTRRIVGQKVPANVDLTKADDNTKVQAASELESTFAAILNQGR